MPVRFILRSSHQKYRTSDRLRSAPLQGELRICPPEPQLAGAAAVQVHGRLRAQCDEDLLKLRQRHADGVALLPSVGDHDGVVQFSDLSDGGARLPARRRGGDQIKVGGKGHRLTVAHQLRAELEALAHALGQKLLPECLRILAAAVHADVEVAVGIHDEHAARRLMGSQKRAVADDRAVLVHAIVVGVDRKHRVAVGDQLRERRCARIGDLCAEAIGRGELHVRDEVDDAVLLEASDGNGAARVLVAVIEGPRKADRGQLVALSVSAMGAATVAVGWMDGAADGSGSALREQPVVARSASAARSGSARRMCLCIILSSLCQTALPEEGSGRVNDSTEF